MQLTKFCKLIGYTAFYGLFFTNIANAAATDPNDPYENYNRHAYQLNKTLDKIAFKPIAQLYQNILPPPVTKAIGNFFSNLNLVPTVANDILQGNAHETLSDTWRFFFNSTAGVGGLFDVASHMGLPPHSEDMGLTFAKWGYKESSYFVIPILGPSTVRDTIGIPIDYEVLSVYPYITNVALRNTLVGTNFVNRRAQLLKFDNVMAQAALDPYTFERNAYLQHRSYLINKNKSGEHVTADLANDDPVSLAHN